MYSYWNDDNYLSNSNGNGRVVAVKAGEAGSQKIEKYISNLNAERDAQISAIEAKYQKALEVLKSK